MSDESNFVSTGITGSLILSAENNREIVRITPDGRVIVNPEFTVDEAARAFWDAVKEIALKDVRL